MRHATTFVLLLLLATGSLAQKKPRSQPRNPVADPNMVVDDRGTKLEVLPAERAEPRVASSGRQILHSISQTHPAEPVSPARLGVVFNHAMQVYGYFTGEIAFKVKGGAAAADLASYPGFAKLTGPDVYLVVARTPAEYVDFIKQLQNRSDLEWVEPIVVYGAPQMT